MSSLAELPELVGFFSYSRDDDADFKGSLSALRDAIARELAANLGRSSRDFRLFQGKEAIAPGKLWEAEIGAAAGQAAFFIPIITPRSMKSKYCGFEFQAFLEREKALGRNDLVFPILYLPVPDLNDETKWRNDPVLSVVGARQYFDWRPFRHLPMNATATGEEIERFCAKLVAALREPWISPDEARAREVEAAALAAEDERRRRERQAVLEQEEAARLRAEQDAYRAQEDARALVLRSASLRTEGSGSSDADKVRALQATIEQQGIFAAPSPSRALASHAASPGTSVFGAVAPSAMAAEKRAADEYSLDGSRRKTRRVGIITGIVVLGSLASFAALRLDSPSANVAPSPAVPTSQDATTTQLSFRGCGGVRLKEPNDAIFKSIYIVFGDSDDSKEATKSAIEVG